MNLEQAIHAHWADSTALTSLLAADGFTTGQTSGGGVPYATLDLQKVRSRLPTNQGAALTQVDLRINVWHNAYDAGRTMVEQVVAAFDGATLELDEPAQVARLRHATDSIRQYDDGLWHWAVGFTANVCRLP